MELSKIQSLVWDEYCKNGYRSMWELEDFFSIVIYKVGFMSDKKSVIDQVKRISDVAEVGLINTEVSELLENVRKGELEEYGEEIADIIIRVLNFATRKGINVEYYILKKHEKNMEREKLHGRIV